MARSPSWLIRIVALCHFVMNNASPTRWIRPALVILCSFASLGLSLSTGNWYIFGAWWLVCLLAFPVCFIIALLKGNARVKSETSNENIR